MATRILNRKPAAALTALQANVEAGQGDTPKASLTWTISELRPYFQGAGDYFFFVDDQQLIQIASEDVATYGKPHVIAVQIKQPVQIHQRWTDRSNAANNVGVDTVIEETASTS